MGGFSLHLVTDGAAESAEVERRVAAALRAGVDWVQLREKAAAAGDLYALAVRLLDRAAAAGAGVLVNDRVDVAAAAGARGVHLSRRGLPVAAARAVLGPGRLIGVSVHSVEEAVAAARAGADYVTYGNVFATRSHPGRAGHGPDALRRAVEAVDVPVLAIGGVGVPNLDAVLATGCAGVAVISAILQREDAAQAAAALREALEASPHRPRRPFPPSGPTFPPSGHQG